MVNPRFARLAALLAGGLAACAHGGGNTRDTASLPTYSVDDSGLFDDSLARTVFGLPSGDLAITDDPDLERRVAHADSVSVVKVATVTSDNNGNRPMYHLVLRPQGNALAGDTLPPSLIEVDIGDHDPAVALLHASGDNLSGSSLIVFLKRYKDRGQAVFHFHAEPDNKEVRQAVAKAKSQQTED